MVPNVGATDRFQADLEGLGVAHTNHSSGMDEAILMEIDSLERIH